MANLTNKENISIKPLPEYKEYKSPKITKEMLPEVLYNYAEMISEKYQQPFNFVAISSITALAGLIGNRVEVSYNGRKNIPIVWSLLIAESGIGKTPSINYAIEPIRDIQKNNKYKSIEQSESLDRKNNLINIQIKARERELSRAKEKEDISKFSEEINSLKDGLLKQPYPRQIIENSTTWQALIKSMKDNNPNGLLYVNDEISGFFEKLDKKDNEEEKSFFNTIYNGYDYSYKTVGRGCDYVENPTLSIIGGIQPSKLNKIVRNYDNSGFLARFQLITFERPFKRYIKKVDTSNLFNGINEIVIEDNYKQVFIRLNNIPYSIDVLDGQHITNEPLVYEYSKEAQNRFEEWFISNEDLKHDKYTSQNIREYLCKAENTIHSLALIFHLSENSIEDKIINIKYINMAINLIEFSTEQAKYMYGELAYNTSELASALLLRMDKLKEMQQKNSYIDRRLIKQRGWTSLKDYSIIDEVLEHLYEYGYLKKLSETTRKTTRYILNLDMSEKYLQNLH
ncbi:DUF3987 domain-containing protein [Pseudofrancisella aestuarii]|uniref:DUF3987 domain-containing protein n=1 Tax=Pseudofrancisella aestuarii TaxID=2670347 RepID=A0ABV9TBQ1_9GAMM|nr:DUF3987 domain-containing protein [Pseudofrancisella aestuarii]